MQKLWFLFIVTAASLCAQQVPGLNCQVNSGATPLVRVEGLAELGGDLTITCTAGVPTPQGTTVPQVDLAVYLNTSLQSRVLAGAFTEALLTIDEPAPGNRVLCIPSGTSTGCPVTGVGGPSGVNFASGGVPKT